jgi:hypothetical protein
MGVGWWWVEESVLREQAHLMEHVDMGWATNKVLKSPSFWSWPSSGDSEGRSHGPRRVLAMQEGLHMTDRATSPVNRWIGRG